VHPASGFRVWFLQPFGMLTQVGEQVDADAEVARFLSVRASVALDQRRQGDERAIYLHDWRALRSYTPETRTLMTNWGLAVRARTERIVIAFSPQAKMVKMGVGVATMALQVAGFTVRLVDDLEPELRDLGVRHSPGH